MLVEALVRAVGVEMSLILGKHGTGVSFVVAQHPVGAFGPPAAAY